MKLSLVVMAMMADAAKARNIREARSFFSVGFFSGKTAKVPIVIICIIIYIAIIFVNTNRMNLMFFFCEVSPVMMRKYEIVKSFKFCSSCSRPFLGLTLWDHPSPKMMFSAWFGSVYVCLCEPFR